MKRVAAEGRPHVLPDRMRSGLAAAVPFWEARRGIAIPEAGGNAVKPVTYAVELWHQYCAKRGLRNLAYAEETTAETAAVTMRIGLWLSGTQISH